MAIPTAPTPSRRTRAQSRSSSQSNPPSFRIGRVRAYLRGEVWYLCYWENGHRRQPRVSRDQAVARQQAAEINAQLESGAPSNYGFDPISFTDLQRRWLDHHEYVRRTSLQTIRRYRAATNHLLRFTTDVQPVRRVSDFRTLQAEAFVRYLREVRVAPNGHAHAVKRPLRDKGVKFILEICSTLLNYAAKNRHLPPYASNPFQDIEIRRIPVENAKPIEIFTCQMEENFLKACDSWQFPIFATLFMTGLRPAELTHLMLPDDLDLKRGWLRIRNKRELGWQIKTRNEREIPISSSLCCVLEEALEGRSYGPVFRQRRCSGDFIPPLDNRTPSDLERIYRRRCEEAKAEDRQSEAEVAKTIWRDLGALKNDQIRREFNKVTDKIGRPDMTAPKSIRHTFATIMQEANVDPLVRNQLMGHVPGSTAHG